MKWLVIEPPWSRFTSDCRRCWHPPRPNNEPLLRRYEFSGVFENTPRDAGGATWRESICVGITEMGPEVNALPHTIIESPCLGECLHSDPITFVDIISSSQTPTMK
jgi:hypothetical protein